MSASRPLEDALAPLEPAVVNDLVYDETHIARRLHISPRSLERWRMTGDGPPYLKLGRRVVYRERDVEEWLDAHAHAQHAAEETASLDLANDEPPSGGSDRRR
jgi:hypothetical protein